MAVDPNWLRKTRMKNMQAVGLAGMGETPSFLKYLPSAPAVRAPQVPANGAGISPGVTRVPVTAPAASYLLYGAIAVGVVTIGVLAYQRLAS